MAAPRVLVGVVFAVVLAMLVQAAAPLLHRHDHAPAIDAAAQVARGEVRRDHRGACPGHAHTHVRAAHDRSGMSSGGCGHDAHGDDAGSSGDASRPSDHDHSHDPYGPSESDDCGLCDLIAMARLALLPSHAPRMPAPAPVAAAWVWRHAGHAATASPREARPRDPPASPAIIVA